MKIVDLFQKRSKDPHVVSNKEPHVVANFDLCFVDKSPSGEIIYYSMVGSVYSDMTRKLSKPKILATANSFDESPTMAEWNP